jgi:hypothetical protein
VVPTTPSGGAAQPRRPATTIDPWADPAPAPALVSRSTTRRRPEPAKVIGIDSLGRSSEELPPEPPQAARPQSD